MLQVEGLGHVSHTVGPVLKLLVAFCFSEVVECIIAYSFNTIILYIVHVYFTRGLNGIGFFSAASCVHV